ncbi:MAG: Uma2 family endonuclease [Caldilineaceae bacterium]|nr:Uma2 family endonuclease [Caldilineaceae bacterium]
MNHIAKPVADMDAAVKPDTGVSVPAQGNGLATKIEPGSATSQSPAAAPNGGTASNAWWDYIKALDHYDPAYPYDPRHVYGPDWTDDDAYGKDGVTFMATPAHQTSVRGCHDEAQRLLGRGHVFQERCLRLPDLGVPKTNRYAKRGQVIPDVFIQEQPRPDERRHKVVYDLNNPIRFVLEVLSESSFRHDLEPKVEIYRAMGVREFWRYDPERWHHREDEPRLWGLRLSADGKYEDIEPLRMADGLPVYRSDTLGEFHMLDEGGDIHTLQTWDAQQGIWMDPKQATVLDTGMANMLSQLKPQVARGDLEAHVPDTLAAAWQRAGWVPDAADAVDVLLGAEDWTSLLPPGDNRT